MFLMKVNFHFHKWFGSKKSETEIELNFIQKYSTMLRKFNNTLLKLKLKI